MPVAREPEGGDDYKIMPTGTWEGRCTGIWDLGSHWEQGDGWAKTIHKILIQFEIPEHRIEIDGKDLPMVISQKYTLSLHQKSNLRPLLETWRDKPFTPDELKGFETKKCLGVYARIQVFHNENSKGDKTFANINSLGPPFNKATNCTIEPVYYDLNEHGLNIPEGTPEWIRKIIEDSDEYQLMSGKKTGTQGPEDDGQPPVKDTDYPF